VSMLGAINAKRQRGEMTMEKAQTAWRDLLRHLQYGTEGYFLGRYNGSVNLVLYGRKDVEGKKPD